MKIVSSSVNWAIAEDGDECAIVLKLGSLNTEKHTYLTIPDRSTDWTDVPTFGMH